MKSILKYLVGIAIGVSVLSVSAISTYTVSQGGSGNASSTDGELLVGSSTCSSLSCKYFRLSKGNLGDVLQVSSSYPFLRWTATSSLGITGGSATPAGSDGQIQFNNSGAFGATSTLFWDKVKRFLGIGTSTPGYPLTVVGTSSLQDTFGTFYDYKARVYDIRAYGAKVDGVTDDITALQLAINTASSSGGGEVLLPQGTTLVNSFVTMRQNVCLVGVGPSSILKQKNGANVDPFIRGTWVDNACIKNLTVDYNHGNNPSDSVGMSIASSTRVKITDSYFKNAKGFAIGLVGNSTSTNPYAYVARNYIIDPLSNPNDLLLVASNNGEVIGNTVTGANANISIVPYDSINILVQSNKVFLAASNTSAIGIGMLSLQDSTVVDNKVYGASTTYTGTGLAILTEFDNATPTPLVSKNNLVLGNTFNTLATAIEIRDTSGDNILGNRLEKIYQSFQFPLGYATSATNIWIRQNFVDTTAVINNPKGATLIWYKDNAPINVTTKEASGAEYDIRTITSGATGAVDVLRDNVLYINKTVGSTTTITIGDGSTVFHGKTFTIKDRKGDAATNPILINTTGGQTIDGVSTTTISTNYGAKTFQWNGDEWSVLQTNFTDVTTASTSIKSLFSAIYPIIYNSVTGVFSSGFSTSTTNIFTANNTFNASTTLASTTITNLLVSGQTTLATASGTGLTITGNSFLATSTISGFLGVASSTPNYRVSVNSGSNSFAINESGYVGIGVFPQGNANYKVDVTGGGFRAGATSLNAFDHILSASLGRINLDQGVSIGTGIGVDVAPPSNGLYVKGNTNIGTTTPSTTSLFVQGTTTQNPFTVASSSGSTLFTVLANGNTGIGSSSPSSLLTVTSTSSMRAVLPETTLTYDLGASTSRWKSGWISTLNLGTSTFSLGQPSTTRLGLFNNAEQTGTEVMSFLTSGSIGVGSTSPSDTFTVNGSINVTGSVKVNGVPLSAGSGLTSLNGQTGSTQTFASSTSGVDFSIVSSGNVHTFTLPDASASARGLLTSSDFTTFTNKPSFTYASSTFVTYAYASSSFVDLISNQTIGGNKTFTGTTNLTNWTGSNGTSSVLAVPSFLSFLNATGTGLTLTNLFSQNENIVNSVITNATATTLFTTTGSSSLFRITNASTTNLSILGQLNDINGTDGLAGQVLLSTGTSTQWTSTSSLGITGGTTYTGTYPIIVSGSVISSGFATNTNNVFTALNTFNASTTLASTTITNLLVSGQTTFSNASSTGITTNNLFVNTNSTTSRAYIFRLGAGVVNGDSASIEAKSFNSPFIQGLRIEGDNIGNTQFSTFLTGDSFTRFSFLTDGQMKWSSGAVAPDTNLYRAATSTLKTDNNLLVVGSSTMGTTTVSFINVGGTSTPSAMFSLRGTLTNALMDIASSTGALIFRLTRSGIQINGGEIPTVSTSTGIGTASGTIALRGRQNGGYITFTTGNAPATNALIATVTNKEACPNGLVPNVSPATTSAVSLATSIFATSTTASTWQLRSGATALTGTTTYIWSYHTFCW